MQTHHPLASLQRIISSWWFLFLSMVVGGLLGMAIHFLLPTVYEASVVISVGMDFAQLGELTDIEHDHAMEGVGDIFFVPDVLDAVGDVTSISGNDLIDFFSAERSFNTWILSVRNEDPVAAQRLASAWAEISVDLLNDLLNHAVLGDLLEDRADELNDCIIGVPSEPVYGLCGLNNLDELLAEYSTIRDLIQEERLQSRGILPGMSFLILESGEPQAVPVLFERNTLVLAGFILGGILAFSLLYFGFEPPRITKHAK
jgi:hypothetical protein